MSGRWVGNSLIPCARTEPPTGNKVIDCHDPHSRRRTQAPGCIQPSKHPSTKECRGEFKNPPPILKLDGLSPSKMVEHLANVPVKEDARDLAVENLVAEANSQVNQETPYLLPCPFGACMACMQGANCECGGTQSWEDELLVQDEVLS